MNNTTKALITALVFLGAVVLVIATLHKSAREHAPAVDAALLSEFSSGLEKFVSDSLSRRYEPSTGLVEEASTAEETTTVPRETEAPTLPVTETTVEVYYDEVDAYTLHGGYVGTFDLTAYEWTGNPMANGEYPYYGACASNYFALGTVLYIDGYGTFTVCDRGRMADNVIDIYLGDPDECDEFGRKFGVDVYYAD